ncbi:helix-turn-helix transcriptional regulator [Candidatus Liberibacter sp.]|uniref:helix-turn-helix transcriptional regulator n=1 Tax=Candidatus Liberibacter sp. TaxID=34022 RepID=UPI0015F5AA90|nr:helix-turn-helix transcriptional regulator [Candidatus Liberibacter sp.]MBA5724665.1 helix-turn-helix domain-containing protein [Candidatus Liberibacter sp.]
MIITPEIRKYWEAVGTRIRDIRKEKGKTQAEMAIGANQLESAVNQFENGIRSTSINYALYLRNEYGASFDWIYDGETILKAHKPQSLRCKVLDPVAIGARIKELRQSLGLNRVEFGKMVGLRCAYISIYEIGTVKPRIETAKMIKKTTKKHLDWIYFGDEVIIPKSVIRAQKAKSAKSK